MIAVNNLSVEFSSKPVFSDISFFVNNNDKIALVGKNGAGKSTLLKIIAGMEIPSAGTVGKPSELSIGYLPQQMKLADDTSIIEETMKVFSGRFQLEEELEKINIEIERHPDPEGEEFEKLLERADFISQTIHNFPISEIESDTEKTLLGLGFKREDFRRPTKELSGGWRMRVELAKILLSKPDLLLLDEPTNHLDIESIQWLENFIRTKAKAVILVSHDRAFLDNVTDRTIEISCGNLYDYKVSYSQFVALRKERVEQQLKAYQKQQKEIEDIKDFIERFRYKATKAVQVQSRIKQLEKIKPIEIDEIDKSAIRLKFPPAERTGDFPLIVEEVGKIYGDHKVFEDVNFTLRRGEKVAFVGKNGEGKSTLVKCIMDEISHSGNINRGHNVKIGYFAQNQAQLLKQDITVFDTIDHVATGDIRTRINDILGAFMFGGDESSKKVEVLSGGEKTRLAMIKLLLEPVNFLILDEPTNHLDIKTKDILKEAIANFTGTAIIVSHDREFLDGLVEKIYEFKDGKVIEHLGGVYDFLQKKKIESLSELEISLPQKTSSVSGGNNPGNYDKTNKKNVNLSYQEQKEREKTIKRAEKEILKHEERISSLESRIKEIEELLGSGRSEPELLADYQSVSEELNIEMKQWEEAQQNYDKLIEQ